MRFSSGRLVIPDAEVDGGRRIVIITALCLATMILTGSSIHLVEIESVWTEISGLSDSRKLETPVPSVFLYKPIGLPVSSLSASAVTFIHPS